MGCVQGKKFDHVNIIVKNQPLQNIQQKPISNPSQLKPNPILQSQRKIPKLLSIIQLYKSKSIKSQTQVAKLNQQIHNKQQTIISLQKKYKHLSNTFSQQNKELKIMNEQKNKRIIQLNIQKKSYQQNSVNNSKQIERLKNVIKDNESKQKGSRQQIKRLEQQVDDKREIEIFLREQIRRLNNMFKEEVQFLEGMNNKFTLSVQKGFGSGEDLSTKENQQNNEQKEYYENKKGLFQDEQEIVLINSFKSDFSFKIKKLFNQSQLLNNRLNRISKENPQTD